MILISFLLLTKEEIFKTFGVTLISFILTYITCFGMLMISLKGIESYSLPEKCVIYVKSICFYVITYIPFLPDLINNSKASDLESDPNFLMITILVPNDYSKNADHALRFAMQLAAEKPVKLVVLQVGEILILTSTPHHLYKDLYSEKVKEKLQGLKDHVSKIIHRYELPNLHFEYDWVDSSDFQETLEKETEKYKPELIVMGTKGASGISKVLMGSNTVTAIENSKVPVLAIPENVELNFIKSVSYASDLQEIKREMKVLVKFAQHFDWGIRIFHVLPNYPEWVDPSKDNMEFIISDLEKSYPDQAFSIELIPTKEENDIIEGIELYVKKFKPDVLVMFPSELTFLDKLLRSSNTEEMAFHSTVPLLVIRS